MCKRCKSSMDESKAVKFMKYFCRLKKDNWEDGKFVTIIFEDGIGVIKRKDDSFIVESYVGESLKIPLSFRDTDIDELESSLDKLFNRKYRGGLQ